MPGALAPTGGHSVGPMPLRPPSLHVGISPRVSYGFLSGRTAWVGEAPSQGESKVFSPVAHGCGREGTHVMNYGQRERAQAWALLVAGL